MGIVKTAVVTSLAAGGLLVGAGAAAAGPEVGAVPAYQATTWHDVNVRTCPSTACLPAAGGPIPEGTTVGVHCWAHGQSVTDFGYTNDVWLNVGRQDGGTQWSSAIYFVGDALAGLPKTAECATSPQPPTTTPRPTTTPAPTTRPAPSPTVAPTTTAVPTTRPVPAATDAPTRPVPATTAPASTGG
ncbi:hypothetical protein ACIGNX_16730 [Actinosynnema sp. NPDC053489]|uniref:hypothetical protein n=1 Tax=Actinosynnema sp. NPDC053489 TaxID=3363916 RepID=UPI0037C6E1C6